MYTITISCPHCGFTKDTPKARVPLRDVQVTCPQCKQGFPLSHGKQTSSETCSVGNAVPPAAAADAADAAPGSNPVKFVEPQVFHIKRQFKLLMLLGPLAVPLMALSVPFNFSQMPVEGAVVLGAFFVLYFAFTVYTVWKFWQPALIFSGQGVEYRLANLFKPQFFPWNRIQGMTVDERKICGKTQIMVRLTLAPDRHGTTEMSIGVAGLDGGDDALALLKRLVPEQKPQVLATVLQRFRPVSTDTLKYRNLEIGREGIIPSAKGGSSRQVVIPWDSVVGISTEGLVIAGFGPVVVRYFDGGVERRLLLRATTSEKYIDCIKLLITNAKKATVDPGVIAILEYPVGSAKADLVAIVLICTGVVLALAASVILCFYPPTVASTWIYPLLLFPLTVAPLVWTIKLLSSRFQGNGAEPSRKLLGAAFFNIGTLLAIGILFNLSPASFIWMLADANTLLGRMDAAETYYIDAEKTLSGNEDFLFTLGQFYARKGDWGKASRYYIRSYEKDPTNWMPQPLAKIPDSLCKAGNYGEALQWCDRIISQYSGRREIVRVIEREKAEIKKQMPVTTEGVSAPPEGAQQGI
jgi:hypothetical protein